MADPINILKAILDVNTRIEKLLIEETKESKPKQSPIAGAAGGTTGDSFKTFAEGVKTMAEGLSIFGKTNAKGVKNFVTSIDSIFKTLNTVDADKVKKGAESLDAVGLGLLSLSKSLVKSAVGFTIALPLIPIIGLSIKFFLKVFEWAGRGTNFGRIMRGGVAMRVMGKGLMRFAGGLAIIGVTVAAIAMINPLLLLAIPATIGLFGVTFGILGIASGLIKRGAWALGLIGLSLISLSFGLVAITLTVDFASKKLGKGNVMKTFGGFLLIVGGLALTFGIAGVFAAPIALGALAMGLVGLSLAAIGWGLNSIVEVTAKTDRETIDNIPELIKAPMLAFADIGLKAPLVLLGAMAGLAVGPALIFLAKGIDAFNKTDIESFNEQKLYSVLTTLGDAFRMLGEGESESTGSLMSLLVGTDFGQTPVERGISAGIKMGRALSSIAQGVGAWADLQNIPIIQGYDKRGNPIYGKEKANIKVALDQINWFLPELSAAFADFADESGGKEGFSITKMLLGNDLSVTPVQRGISNALKMGKALSSIAQGVGSWANLQNIKIIETYDKRGNPIYGKENVNIDVALSNIQTFLPELQKAFEGFEDDKEKSFSITGLIFGNDLAKTPMQRGITNALNMGRVLKITAEGIGVWANLQNLPLIKDYDKNGNAIYGKEKVNITKAISNASNSLKEISFALIDVAGEEGDNTKPLRRAVEAVAPLGELLSGMAEAMSTFANIQNIKIIEEYRWDEKAQRNVAVYSKESVNVDTITNNISYALKSIANALLGVDGGDIEDVTEGLSPVGKMLGGLADSINTFANLENIKIVEEMRWDEKSQRNVPVYSKNSVNVKQVIGNIRYALSEVLGVFSMIEGDAADNIEDAIEGVDGIDKVLTGFARSIKTFAQLEKIPVGSGDNTEFINAFDSVKNIKTSVVDVITMIGKVGGEGEKAKKDGKIVGVYAFEHLKDSFVELAKYSKEFASFADSFKSIATSIGTFADNFNKMSSEDISLYSAWTKTLITFAELDVSAYNTNVEQIKDKFDFGLSDLKDKAKEVFGTDDPEEIENKTEKAEEKDEGLMMRKLIDEVKMLRGDVQGVKNAINSELEVSVVNQVKIRE